jgi:hypothetical protein
VICLDWFPVLVDRFARGVDGVHDSELLLRIQHSIDWAVLLLFSELEGTAGKQGEAFLGTPGSIAERANETGTRFWVHRYFRV